ncbi:hypothetical protein IMY05_001G0028800 [Salix suchowensis]|nr:hypothetical protein IMY05_001G0028800 [Salix suchowensis]
MQSEACHLCDFDLKMHLYAGLLIKYLHASPLCCSHLNSSDLFCLSGLNVESQRSDFN